ncbi:MAG TPA: TadE family protein [Tepidisphaeraceae bacterium]|jgi:Flp pilus assembly protein TadG
MSKQLTKRSNYRNRRGGGTLIELMLMMPVLIALSIGAGEYGYAMYIKHTLQGAAREGARAAVVSGADATSVQTAVDNYMQVCGFAQSKYTRPPTISPSTWTTASAGTSISVTITAQWSNIGIDILPTWLGGIPSTKNITGVTTMRKEG